MNDDAIGLILDLIDVTTARQICVKYNILFNTKFLNSPCPPKRDELLRYLRNGDNLKVTIDPLPETPRDYCGHRLTTCTVVRDIGGLYSKCYYSGNNNYNKTVTTEYITLSRAEDAITSSTSLVCNSTTVKSVLRERLVLLGLDG